MERHETVEKFCSRLEAVIARSGLSRSAFASRVGIDRSTLSQILSRATDRLPRVETLVSIAASERVSLDWLVGLSEEGALATSVLPLLELSPTAGSPTDEQLARWRAESLGYKIRHVPTTLPDALKTEEVIEYEYTLSADTTPEHRRESTQQHLAYERRLESDTEVCTPIQALREFAQAAGIWSELAPGARKRQLGRFAELIDELYPSFRWFLFDARRRFSAPLTIFGPRRAVVYAGQMYLVFNGREHIRELTVRFDQLIRDAVVQPTEIGALLTELRDAI